jgi:hypothetical protein
LDTDLKVVRVVDMYVDCAYPMVPKPAAMSDNCRQPATTTVMYLNRSTGWRCEEHKGLIKGSMTGPVSETVTTRKEIPEELVLSRPEQ